MKKIVIALTAATFVLVALMIFRMKTFDFNKEKISVSFTSYLTEIKGVTRVQLVEMKSVEVIERTSKFALFWNLLKLPDVVVLARVPVTYSYYVDLKEPFTLEHTGQRWVLHAPELRPSLPAADVSAMSFEVKRGSVFRNHHTAFEELRRTVTPLLSEKAEVNKALAAEEGRKQMALLVSAWVDKTAPVETRNHPIDILFGPRENSAP